VAALVAAGFAGSAHAATTTSNHGTILLDGKPLFPLVLSPGPPLGSKTPWGTDALAETAGAGVNVFRVGSGGEWTSADLANVLAYDRAAANVGAYTWVNLHGYALATPGSEQDNALANVVRRVTSDPGGRAIAFWKGRDEPWWAGFPPAALQFAYCRVTSRGLASWCRGEPSLDAGGPLWVTIQAPRGTAADLANFSPVTDVHGVDDYPYSLAKQSAPPLYQVGQWTSTIAAVSPGEPIWTTLQICASGSYDSSTGAYVLPTFQQERYMAYDSILNGATALAFYGGTIAGCWNQSDSQYGWNWTFWQTVLKPLVQQLAATSQIEPALVNSATSVPVTTNDPTTEAVLRQGTSPDDLWLIAARSGIGTIPVTFSGLPSWLRTGDVYTEGRTVSAAGGIFSDSFGEWDVHVYHFVEQLTVQPLYRSSAKVGTRIALIGTGMEGAKSVSFGGRPARFTVVSDGKIVATVPPGARSGPVVVRSSTARVASSRLAILPSLAAPPRVHGVARVGRVLTVSKGRWYGDPARRYSYVWERCNAYGGACTPIGGAHRSRLVLGKGSAGARLRVVVTVKTGAGTAQARTAPTPVVR
jgi:hypothetical protein